MVELGSMRRLVVVPELQLLERFYRLMIAAEAMRRQRRFEAKG